MLTLVAKAANPGPPRHGIECWLRADLSAGVTLQVLRKEAALSFWRVRLLGKPVSIRAWRLNMRMSPRGLVIVLSAINAILVSGCSTHGRARPNGQPLTSYEEMAAPAGASHYTLQPGETAVRPVLDKRVSPVYPPTLARPGAAPVTVVAQLVMDEDGRVKAVRPQSDTAAGQAGDMFEAAVEHAAMQWVFTPMWLRHPRGDGTYQVTQKPFSLWYVFDFRMIDGKPVVESGRR